MSQATNINDQQFVGRPKIIELKHEKKHQDIRKTNDHNMLNNRSAKLHHQAKHANVQQTQVLEAERNKWQK